MAGQEVEIEPQRLLDQPQATAGGVIVRDALDPSREIQCQIKYLTSFGPGVEVRQVA